MSVPFVEIDITYDFTAITAAPTAAPASTTAASASTATTTNTAASIATTATLPVPELVLNKETEELVLILETYPRTDHLFQLLNKIIADFAPKLGQAGINIDIGHHRWMGNYSIVESDFERKSRAQDFVLASNWRQYFALFKKAQNFASLEQVVASVEEFIDQNKFKGANSKEDKEFFNDTDDGLILKVIAKSQLENPLKEWLKTCYLGQNVDPILFVLTKQERFIIFARILLYSLAPHFLHQTLNEHHIHSYPIIQNPELMSHSLILARPFMANGFPTANPLTRIHSQEIDKTVNMEPSVIYEMVNTVRTVGSRLSKEASDKQNSALKLRIIITPSFSAHRLMDNLKKYYPNPTTQFFCYQFFLDKDYLGKFNGLNGRFSELVNDGKSAQRFYKNNPPAQVLVTRDATTKQWSCPELTAAFQNILNFGASKAKNNSKTATGTSTTITSPTTAASVTDVSIPNSINSSNFTNFDIKQTKETIAATSPSSNSAASAATTSPMTTTIPKPLSNSIAQLPMISAFDKETKELILVFEADDKEKRGLYVFLQNCITNYLPAFRASKVAIEVEDFRYHAGYKNDELQLRQMCGTRNIDIMQFLNSDNLSNVNSLLRIIKNICERLPKSDIYGSIPAILRILDSANDLTAKKIEEAILNTKLDLNIKVWFLEKFNSLSRDDFFKFLGFLSNMPSLVFFSNLAKQQVPFYGLTGSSKSLLSLDEGLPDYTCNCWREKNAAKFLEKMYSSDFWRNLTLLPKDVPPIKLRLIIAPSFFANPLASKLMETTPETSFVLSFQAFSNPEQHRAALRGQNLSGPDRDRLPASKVLITTDASNQLVCDDIERVFRDVLQYSQSKPNATSSISTSSINSPSTPNPPIFTSFRIATAEQTNTAANSSANTNASATATGVSATVSASTPAASGTTTATTTASATAAATSTSESVNNKKNSNSHN